MYTLLEEQVYTEIQQKKKIITHPLSLTLSPHRRIADNNLVCDCHLTWLARWLRLHPTLALFTKCAQPSHLRTVEIAELQEDDFRCSGQSRQMSSASQSIQDWDLFWLFLIVCFTSYFVFLAVLPHSPGVVYCHLLLGRETRISGVTPFSFQIGFWDLFVHRGHNSYTPTAFGKLWTTPEVRCMKHASS